ncbi:MAG: hypothetical protein K8T89_14600, partial [Planctomycetes bacterium]|nr:hypothetical protein [Planctomycetota bacterium]
DQFEHYNNPVLEKAVTDGKNVKEVKQLTSTEIGDLGEVLGDTSAVFLIVRTNEDRFSKLLVQAARQRFGKDKQVPMLLIEKYVTFRESTERTVKAKGENVNLYAGSRYNLDIGQAVPESLGGDIQVTDDGKDGFKIAPIGTAKIYVLIKAIPDVVPKKAAKLTVGATFEMRYFIGKYKLYDDGRRTGTLNLEVNESGEVTGTFYSDRDGAKYDIEGKIGTPRHAISFNIKFPQIQQSFNGFLFTGNGKAITGSSKLQEREAGFYAERVEE